MSLWRGRQMAWDPDQQAIEQERQKWVYEKIEGMNTAITDLTVDPRQEYALHRKNYEDTGDSIELMLMLEYVQQ
jgi:hypothetical protein